MKPPLIWCTITQLSSVDHCWAFVGRSSGQCIGIFCDESADSWGCGYSQKHNCCVVVLVPSVFGGLQLCCGQLSHHVVLGWTIQSDAFFVIDWVILVYDWLCVQGRQEDIRKSDAVAARLRLQHVHGVVKVGDIVGCLQLCIPQAESFSTPACLMPLGEQIFILDEWALLCKKKKKEQTPTCEILDSSTKSFDLAQHRLPLPNGPMVYVARATDFVSKSILICRTALLQALGRYSIGWRSPPLHSIFRYVLSSLSFRHSIRKEGL